MIYHNMCGAFAIILLHQLFAFGFQSIPKYQLIHSPMVYTSSQTRNDESHLSVLSALKHMETKSAEPKEYFVSEALFVHLGPAAQILTEAFYSHRTNFITFQVEKLKTALSLESTFDKQRVNPMGKMFVACSSQNGKVVGFAEVDVCSLKNKCNKVIECGINDDENNAKEDLPRPYMYNLAVDKRWQRKGIATELVAACEKFVQNIDRLQSNDQAILQYKQMGYTDPCLVAACDNYIAIEEDEKRWMYLRVRKSNEEAISFYRQLGYVEIDPDSIALTQTDVNSNSAEEGELVLMGRELKYNNI